MSEAIKNKNKTIQLSHGSGGAEMNSLIKDLFFKHLGNEILLREEDAATLQISSEIAFTTDSYTVSPIFFAGGDIGKIAIAGTVNDLAMAGAKPLYLSCGFIIEEGFSFDNLEKIVISMATELAVSGAKIVCGDTKVVPKNCAEGIFINTSGIGQIIYPNLSAHSLMDGDVIVVSRDIGCHGATILMARNELALESALKSDCQTLWSIVNELIKQGITMHALRDATRGGLAAVLNEWARASNIGITVQESSIPVNSAVIGLCELYGFEVYNLANEGTFVLALPKEFAVDALNILKSFNQNAAIIGECCGQLSGQYSGKVVLKNAWGTSRYLEVPNGELLPRIC